MPVIHTPVNLPTDFGAASMGANNVVIDGRTNSTTAETTLYPCWDPSQNRGSATLSNNNLTYTMSGTWSATKATIPCSDISGGVYWEIKLGTVGPATETNPGIMKTEKLITDGTGNGEDLFVSNQSGGSQWYNDSSYVAITGSSAMASGDVLMFAFKGGKIWLGKNGTWWNSGDPDSDSGEIHSSITGSWSPAICASQDSSFTAHFDSDSFVYPIGTTYKTVGFSPITKTVTGFGNVSTFNRLLKTTGTFSNGNLTFLADSQSGFGHSITSTHTMASGTYYAEFVVDSWSGTNHATIGIATTEFVSSGNYAANWTGANTQSWGYYADGSVYTNGSATSSGYTSYTLGDVIGVKLDATNGAVYFYKNGVVQNSGSAAYSSLTGPFVFSVSNAGGSTYTTITANFGQKPFIFQPSSTSALATQNLPTPAVVDYEDEYFIKTGIVHGTGTTAVTLPKTVSGGAMVRIKRTDSTGGWYVADTVRGANKFLYWDNSAVEDTSTWSDQNLTGTTLTLPDALTAGTYMIEVFYVGSYFQMIAYSGTGSAHAENFGSALDTAPGMVWVQRRTASAGWPHVFHSSLANTQALYSDRTNAVASSTAWNNTTPTTSGVTLGTLNDINISGGTYMLYAWANSGPYKFGEADSVNSSGDDFMVNVGGFPQTKFVKKHNTTEGWYFSAYAIDGHNPTKYMSLDSTIAAAADVAYDHLSTGFKSRDTTTSTRGSGHSLVWGAFGITPFASNNRAR